jgi:hypothetical protein
VGAVSETERTHRRVPCLAIVAYLLTLLVSIPTMAYESPWVGASAGYVFKDEDRGAHRGESLAFDGGFKVTQHLAVEIDANLTNFETGKASYTDYYRSSLGARALLIAWPERISPYLAAGTGAVYNNTGHNGVNQYGELTLGVFAPPTHDWGVRWRVELRFLKDNYGVAHDPTDRQIMIGAVIPLRSRCTVRCVWEP